jgi:1-acyl-sn-glycerol-3-phosphate acyltransferase
MSATPKRSWLWKTLQGLCRILTTVLFDLKTYGRENIPKRGGALLLSNHQSYLDPILLGVKLDRPVSYMAKSELFEAGPILPWLIRSLHAFPVKRGSGDVGAIKEAIARLHEGYILNMYPEGTRTEDGEIRKILPGVALVVKRAGVPVIPVVIDGSFNAWSKKQKTIRGFPIRVVFGPPLQLDGLKSEQVLALIDSTLRDMLNRLRIQEGRLCPKPVSAS